MERPHCEFRLRVSNVKVQMRARKASSGIAEQADYLAAFHACAGFDFDAAVLEMFVERIAPAAEVQTYEVSADIFERDRRPRPDGKGWGFHNVIARLRDDAICNRQYLGAVAMPVRDLRLVLTRACAVVFKPHPVDGEARWDV